MEQEKRQRTCEICEQLLCVSPKTIQFKLGATWRCGCFAGRSLSSGQNLITLSDGSVARARSIVRLVPDARWDPDWIMNTNATPLTESTQMLDSIEGISNPHEHYIVDTTESADPPGRTRVKITLAYLTTRGFPNNCARCSLHREGQHRRARCHKQTEDCRARVYKALRHAESPKVKGADAERTQTHASNASGSSTQPTPPTPQTSTIFDSHFPRSPSH